MATKKLTRAEKRAINKQRWARGERWESRDPGAPEPKPKAKKRRRQAKTSANGNGGVKGRTSASLGGGGGGVKGRGSGSLVDGNGNGASGKRIDRSVSSPPQLEFHDTPAKRSNKWQGGAIVRQARASDSERMYAAPARLDGAGPGFRPSARLRAARQAETPARAVELAWPFAPPCRCGRSLGELRAWPYVGRFVMCAKCGHDVLAG
jgi:hypothetical protein